MPKFIHITCQFILCSFAVKSLTGHSHCKIIVMFLEHVFLLKFAN
jgi:hypothetical protein